MRRTNLTTTLAIAAIAALASTFAFGGGAQAANATATLFVVHAFDATGLGPGSSAVTICLDSSLVNGDVTYGQSLGPLPAALGTHSVTVHQGIDQPCDGPVLMESIIDLALGTYVVTAGFDVLQNEPAVFLDQIDDSCVAGGTARVGGGHFADAPPVQLQVDGTAAIFELPIGAVLTAPQATGVHSVAFTTLQGAPLFDAGSIPFDHPVLTIVYITGGYLESTVRTFPVNITLTSCDGPTTTTSTTSSSTTSTTVGTTTTTAKPAAKPVTATPAFAG